MLISGRSSAVLCEQYSLDVTITCYHARYYIPHPRSISTSDEPDCSRYKLPEDPGSSPESTRDILWCRSVADSSVLLFCTDTSNRTKGDSEVTSRTAHGQLPSSIRALPISVHASETALSKAVVRTWTHLAGSLENRTDWSKNIQVARNNIVDIPNCLTVCGGSDVSVSHLWVQQQTQKTE